MAAQLSWRESTGPQILHPDTTCLPHSDTTQRNNPTKCAVLPVSPAGQTLSVSAPLSHPNSDCMLLGRTPHRLTHDKKPQRRASKVT
jgi:hypothetical protein